MSRRLTPLGAVGRGLLASAAGTAAMTAAQTGYYKAVGAEGSSTPAEVGRRLIEGVLQRQVPEERMNALNQAMHVAYGTSWGAPYGIVSGSRRRPAGPLRSALGLGLSVWGASLVKLSAMGLSPPVWEQPKEQVAMDAGFHLVYALAFRALR